MKIAIGIPSYREASSIGFVTEQVDKGLSIVVDKFSSITGGNIFNIDSNSDDNTKEVFLKTRTTWEKHAIQTTGLPGKGKNLFTFFREVVSDDYDIAITLDADLKSIEPNWICKFIEPFIYKNCDFVTPLYERNRFEGSTTNHFAYPIMYTFCNVDIRQPIAGDFAFSRKFIEYILKIDTPDQAMNYGIDIFLSLNAFIFSNKIEQIKLTQKIHKPSFPNLQKIFPQVASSALDIIRLMNINKTHGVDKKIDDSIICINDNIDFNHKNEASILLEIERQYLLNNIDKILWISKSQKDFILKMFTDNKFHFDRFNWADTLSQWFLYAIKNKNVDSIDLANQLLPFFVLRSVYFWNTIVGYTPREVEKEIKDQTKLIKQIIINNL